MYSPHLYQKSNIQHKMYIYFKKTVLFENKQHLQLLCNTNNMDIKMVLRSFVQTRKYAIWNWKYESKRVYVYNVYDHQNISQQITYKKKILRRFIDVHTELHQNTHRCVFPCCTNVIVHVDKPERILLCNSHNKRQIRQQFHKLIRPSSFDLFCIDRLS